jgi:hypothetical protein
MAAVKNIERTKYNGRKLTDEQVYVVLTSHHLTTGQLADMMGVNSSTIQKVRRGNSSAHLFPEIPRDHKRATGPRCTECIHNHHGACSLEFPERRFNGEVAAVHCAAYTTEEE